MSLLSFHSLYIYFDAFNCFKYIKSRYASILNKKTEKIMLTILIRTVVIYIALTVILRLMGKRQLGELDVGELVITIILSEIAATPITNPDSSLLEAIVPALILALLEILTSILILKTPLFKSLLSSKPAVVMARGVINYNMMKKVRISLEELISQVRQNGVYDLAEVDYAILEENGKMSVIPKNRNRQPDKSDLEIQCPDNGLMHLIISDGSVNMHGLTLINKDRAWLERRLQGFDLAIKDIFCMTVDDVGKIFIQKHDGKQIVK